MPVKTCETIYVVDDDETYQFIVKRVIEETRLVNSIRVFSNGLEAIECIENSISQPESLPEVILLDLWMPVMDGWEFLEKYLLLKPKVGKRIYIYIVSSSINPIDVQRARNITEVTDYVVKPITRDKLVSMLQSL
ncbi:MAG: response regulator [Bacteroidetes bacterium]|nr:response regulator [Bacteroidota bacterium]